MLKEEGINEVLKKVKETDVTALQRYLFGDTDKPLLVANMGCSIGVSTYCAMLYEMSVYIAEVKNCYEVQSMADNVLKQLKLLIVSSSGRNDDVVYLGKRAKDLKMPLFANLSSKLSDKNKLSRIVSEVNPEHSFCFDIACEEDAKSFVPIYNMLAEHALIYKAFTNKSDFVDLPLPDGFNYTANDGVSAVPPLSDINHYFVLYGHFGKPIAYDLECQLVESATASVTISTMRNYCHGRFIYTSNYLDSSVLVLLVTPRDKKVVEGIRKALPPTTPIIIIESEIDAPLATIDLYLKTLPFIEDASEAHETSMKKPKNKGRVDKRHPQNYAKFISEFKKNKALTLLPIETK